MYTLPRSHNMCKAKMLLTALNKLLNHLRQAEGSERSERASERAERRKRFPSQAKCRNKCIVFQSENLESESHLPRDARGLLFLAICNFKYISMGVCVRTCICVKYACERKIPGEKETESDGSEGPSRRRRQKKKTQLYSVLRFNEVQK